MHLNNKLQALAYQAGFIGEGFSNTVFGTSQEHALKNFAELIVRECADAGDMAYDDRCPYVGDYIAGHMGYGEEHGITNWRMDIV